VVFLLPYLDYVAHIELCIFATNAMMGLYCRFRDGWMAPIYRSMIVWLGHGPVTTVCT